MPPIGIKKTAEGILFTTGVLKSLGWLLIVSASAVTYMVRTGDHILSAVPRREFTDTTAALRRDMTKIATDAKEAGERSTSIGCYIARYPAGLCDNVPRAAQPGRARVP